MVSAPGAAETGDTIERRLSPESAADEDFSQQDAAPVTKESFQKGLDKVRSHLQIHMYMMGWLQQQECTRRQGLSHAYGHMPDTGLCLAVCMLPAAESRPWQ